MVNRKIQNLTLLNIQEIKHIVSQISVLPKGCYRSIPILNPHPQAELFCLFF